jgi:3',5'-cyclic AMP phosphodiesterase CpdA
LADTPAAEPQRVRVLHLSDIHFGHPFVQAHVDAALAVARAGRWNAIVISGDFTQRARVHEFESARELLAEFRSVAPVITVPGNHDSAWWQAPFGFGDFARVHERYRRYICADTEPSVSAPGVTLVGLNSSWGTNPEALTWYPRDWRVKGGLTDAQLRDAHTRLAAAPAGDLRILVVHHNVVRGRLSNRWGLKQPQRVLAAIAAMPVDVVCTGHDHEERVELIDDRVIVSVANTLSRRMRGRRSSAINVIEASASAVAVQAWCYVDGVFEAGPLQVSVDRPASATMAHR